MDIWIAGVLGPRNTGGLPGWMGDHGWGGGFVLFFIYLIISWKWMVTFFLVFYTTEWCGEIRIPLSSFLLTH